MSARTVEPPLAGTGAGGEAAIYRKVSWRLLPFLLVCYVLAYLDRVNIGYAKFGMQPALGLTDAAYGLGAGIFFIGYVLFEVPSGLWQVRIGVRRTISRIMLLWGLTSIATVFVRGEYGFYALRFMLGVFEAGFAPGMLFYLSCWFPRARRAQIMAVVLLAGPVSNVLGGPVSTAVLSGLDGVAGLAGWQWMFIVEGVPSVLAGFVAFFYLADTPRDAAWLTADERSTLAAALERDEGKATGSFAAAIRDPRIYGFAAVYFCLISGLYTVSFWLPTLLREAGVRDVLLVGWLSAVPYLAAIAAMLLNARWSDRSGERRWHVAVPAALGAAGLAAAASVTGQAGLALAGICVATLGTYAAYAVFWAAPSAYLKGRAAAGGIALINSIGAFGGFVSPFVIGWLKTGTGSLASGLFAMAAFVAVGAVLEVLTAPAPAGGAPMGDAP